MILKYVCINCMCLFGRIGGKSLSDHEKRWHSVNKLDWIRSIALSHICKILSIFPVHHNARQLQHSCAGPCCLLPRAWAMKNIHNFFPVHRPVPTSRLAMSFLRPPRSLEVRAWEHNKVKQRHFACFVGCYCSNIVSWITWLYRWYWLAAVYLNNALINFTP